MKGFNYYFKLDDLKLSYLAKELINFIIKYYFLKAIHFTRFITLTYSYSLIRINALYCHPLMDCLKYFVKLIKLKYFKFVMKFKVMKFKVTNLSTIHFTFYDFKNVCREEVLKLKLINFIKYLYQTYAY